MISVSSHSRDVIPIPIPSYSHNQTCYSSYSHFPDDFITNLTPVPTDNQDSVSIDRAYRPT